MPRRIHLTRSHAILRIKRRLEQDAFPRIQMSLIVGLTGAAGLLFSFVMLKLGVTSMAVRYPLALLMAYGVFLLLLNNRGQTTVLELKGANLGYL